MSNFQYLHEFSQKHGRTWTNIIQGEAKTNEILNQIHSNFSSSPAARIFSSDVDLVVFGSLARNECTESSDVDWTLLIDGQSRPEHYSFGHIVTDQLEKAQLQQPGASGMFGQITFGHDLINYIGGEDDTNHNTSRRILMLLESDNITWSGSFKGGTAYERILLGILNQYIDHDSGFKSDRGAQTKVPRFFLNDLIRFWRTMCVDFAYKQRQQQGKKWALRNIKLRISRKLIFVKGLLMCISCYNNEDLLVENLEEHLKELSVMKPLDVLLKVCCDNNIDEVDLVNLLTVYDEFLGLLNDHDVRKELTELEMLEVYDNQTFITAREITDRFQASLNNIFLIKESKVREFTLRYGIFKPLIGFSTGSIALGDFSAGITYLKEKEIDVIELSTLREFELINFLKNIDLLDVSSFKYISFHAPSKLTTLNEHEFVSLLKIVAAKKWLIIVHPDIIEDFELWDKSLGNLLCIENMDKRKHIGRTAADLEYIFEKLPQASFCFDVAHARQVDSTMSEAKLMISKFKHRLKQVHLSDVNSESKHESLSLESLLAYSTLFENIPKTIPVILESPIDKQNLEREIKTASLIFNPEKLVDFIKPYGKHSNYFRYYIDYFSKHHSE